MATTNKKILERIVADKERLLEELNKASGIVSAACRACNISRYTYYEWYNSDEEFREKADDVKELQKDFCESLILQKMKQGDTTMIIFYAKTQMKDRGYSERKELVGKDGEDLIKHQEIDISKLTPEQRAALLSIGKDLLDETEG